LSEQHSGSVLLVGVTMQNEYYLAFCLCFGHHGSINWTVWSSRDMCVNWNEPQVSRIQLYEQPSTLNDVWVWAGGCKRSLPRHPKGQSRTCYQECGCHL